MNEFENSCASRVPKTLPECYSSSQLSTSLFNWSKKINIFGKILCIIIIIVGIIIAIMGSMTTTTTSSIWASGRTRTEFDFVVFLVLVLAYGVCAFIEYCIYNVLSLIVGSIGSIVHNARVAANVAIYKASSDNCGEID